MNTGNINYLALTLRELAEGFTTWRSQVIGLARNDFRKKTKKTALGTFWLVFHPVVYIACFWFALYVGIKTAKNGLDGLQYLLWLASGVMPWWFMQAALNQGPSYLTGHSFLITKLKFPVALIPVFAQLSHFFLHIILVVILLILHFMAGHGFDLYLLQLPLLMIMMLVFWTGYSMLVSSLCIYSKDLVQLLKALTTPIFWLSGIIFDVSSIGSNAIQTALLFNPVTFFATAYRGAMCGIENGYWFWSDTTAFLCFLLVAVVTCVLGVVVFAKLRKDFADVL